MYEAGRSSKRERAAFDDIIIDWADGSIRSWLEGDLTWYSGAAGREVTKPKGLLVAHLFNHQTHHRGQVHCLLTQCRRQAGRHRSALHARKPDDSAAFPWPPPPNSASVPPTAARRDHP